MSAVSWQVAVRQPGSTSDVRIIAQEREAGGSDEEAPTRLLAIVAE